MRSSADELADRLAAQADAGGEVEIWGSLGRMTLDVRQGLGYIWVLPVVCGPRFKP